jgi:hypothetical protein
MAVAPRGHRHRGRANNPFFISQQAEWRSRQEGTDIAGELLKHNSRPTAVMANEGTRLRASYIGRAGRAKGHVYVTAGTHCNDGGKRALWMLAKRSKMSERSQCQDEGEQRPGDERRANSGGFLRDQQSTANPNLCSAEEIKGRERMQGICMPERHHEPKLVFGRRGSRAQTISTSLCRRGSRNSSSCLAK